MLYEVITVFIMLVGDEVGNVPREEREGLSGEAAWFVNGNRWFHGGAKVLSAAAYTTAADPRKASRVYSVS